MRSKLDLTNLVVAVIDDNKFMLKLMRVILHSMRVGEVHAFEDAVEALGLIDTGKADAIFVDWSLGMISGEEMVRMVRRRREPICYTPIIVFTGHASKAVVRRARTAGADYTIGKPVSVEMIFRAFEQLVARPRHFVEVGHYFGPDRRRKSMKFEWKDRRADIPPTPHTVPPAISG